MRAWGLKINTDLINLNRAEVKPGKPESADYLRAEGGAKAEPHFEPQLGAAIRLIESKGYKLDEKSLQTVKDFMLNGEGSVSDKLEAIETVLAKDMPLKEALLSRLQGFSKKSLLDFLPENLGFAGGKEGRGGSSAPSTFPSTLRGEQGPGVRMGQAGRSDEETVVSRVEAEGAVLEGVTGKGRNREAGTGDGRNQLQTSDKGAAPAHGLEARGFEYRGGVSEDAGSEGAGFERGIEKIDELLRSLLNEIEEGASFPEGLSETEQDMLVSYLAGAASINESFSSRAVLMTKITPKLQELKQDFENLKKDLKLDFMRLKNPEKPVSSEEAVKALEKNIEKLDRALMRSEMSLYMDLKGERQLLKLSSQLGEARELLQSGLRGGAEEKLGEVLKALEKLDYVPSIKKAMLLYDTGLEREQALEIRNMKGLAEWLGDRAARYNVSEGSASSLASYIRKLGLGAEAEQFEAMTLAKNKSLAEAKDFVNLKSLLKDLAVHGAKPTDREAATQMLGRIEALDLKNKILDTREAQSLSLELPLKLNGSIKSVKVFIQSPEHARKLDWENFNMFFVLTTERLGELGIKVEAVQRSLSVSILNDEAKKIDKNYDFKGNFKKEVEDLGFRLVKMILEEWKGKSKAQKPDAKALKPAPGPLSEEGRFDMSI